MKPDMSVVVLATALVTAGSLAAQAPPSLADQVRAAETAFAGTMARRDLTAFGDFVSTEAIFFGRASSLKGRPAVVEGWKSLFDGPAAPFSWAPETVEVLASGTLALSSGPVLDPSGKRVGTFNSVWRLESDGHWRVIFDKGCPVCQCATPPGAGTTEEQIRP